MTHFALSLIEVKKLFYELIFNIYPIENPSYAMLLLLLLSRISHVRLCATPETAAHQAPPRPWDSPGKNTGVGFHFLLQCMKVFTTIITKKKKKKLNNKKRNEKEIQLSFLN